MKSFIASEFNIKVLHTFHEKLNWPAKCAVFLQQKNINIFKAAVP